MNKPMLQEVQEILSNNVGEWPRFAAESGVPYSTIAKIGGKVTDNPRINTVQALYDYFKSGQKVAA
jgi:predicted transcriptional regulator